MHEKDEEESIPRINLFGNRQSQDENDCGFGAVSLAKQCEDSKSSFKTDSSFEDEDLEGMMAGGSGSTHMTWRGWHGSSMASSCMWRRG